MTNACDGRGSCCDDFVMSDMVECRCECHLRGASVSNVRKPIRFVGYLCPFASDSACHDPPFWSMDEQEVLDHMREVGHGG